MANIELVSNSLSLIELKNKIDINTMKQALIKSSRNCFVIPSCIKNLNIAKRLVFINKKYSIFIFSINFFTSPNL